MILLLLMVGLARSAEPVVVTILHTNDLHSHFRPDRGPLRLGGVARLTTAARLIREKEKNVLFVDGGDWSEGDIYYRLDAGAETLRMMGRMGYDVAIVGNHDWLNGPDLLLRAIQESGAEFDLVATNIQLDGYPRASEFREKIKGFVVKEVSGIRVGFLGAVTYEYIYDEYLRPIRISNPLDAIKRAAKAVRNDVDALVLISHNQTAMSKLIAAKVPEIDLVIGAHDHLKFTEPVVVSRKKADPAWVVETGCWGWYLGRVDLRVTPRDPAQRGSRAKVEKLAYSLIPMNERVPEDAAVAARIGALEQAVEASMGEPVFHDIAGESEIEIYRDGAERLMGGFVTDAYLSATGADAALEQYNFIYGELHEGEIRTVDVYNAIPPVYSPITGKTWVVHTFEMKGASLFAWLNLVLAPRKSGESTFLSMAGMEIVYRPAFFPFVPILSRFVAWLGATYAPGFQSVISRILIQGEPLVPTRTYRIAASQGVVKGIEIMNRLVKDLFPIQNLQATEHEEWRAVLSHLKNTTPVTAEKLAPGTRVRTQQPDLAVLYNDLSWSRLAEGIEPDGTQWIRAEVRVRVRNLGASPSQAGAELRVMGNRNRSDSGTTPRFYSFAEPKTVPALAPGESVEIPWILTIPGDLGVFPVAARISDAKGEINSVNNQTTHYFRR